MGLAEFDEMPLDFSGGTQGKVGPEFNDSRDLERGEAGFREMADGIRRGGRRGVAGDDDGPEAVDGFGLADGDDDAIANFGVGGEDGFDLDGIYLGAGGVDQEADAASQMEVAGGIEPAQVAGAEIAVLKIGIFAEVASEHGCGADGDFSLVIRFGERGWAVDIDRADRDVLHGATDAGLLKVG